MIETYLDKKYIYSKKGDIFQFKKFPFLMIYIRKWNSSQNLTTQCSTRHIFFFFRWPTRVFATECLRMIVTACEVDETHFDMEKARNRKNTTGQGMCIYLALCMYLLSIDLNLWIQLHTQTPNTDAICILEIHFLLRYNWNIVESGVKHHNPLFITSQYCLMVIKLSSTTYFFSVKNKFQVFPVLQIHDNKSNSIQSNLY